MPPLPRAYHSPVRQQQARQTREAIAKAARALFSRDGFAATTVDEIAREAGFAAPTVYALFGSKRGIVAALVEEASFGEPYAALVDRIQDLPDPADGLRTAAQIARNILEAERAEIEFLRGAGVVSPEAAVKEREREQMRFERQKLLIDFIADSGRLKKCLTIKRAREILWSLTSRDLFRLLVVVQGWPPADYEDWLGTLLIAQLLEPAT